jgi:hypothetical protein
VGRTEGSYAFRVSILGLSYWVISIAFFALAFGSLRARRPLATTKKYAARVDYRWFSGSYAALGLAFVFVGIAVSTGLTPAFTFAAAGLIVVSMCVQLVGERLPRRRLPS